MYGKVDGQAEVGLMCHRVPDPHPWAQELCPTAGCGPRAVLETSQCPASHGPAAWGPLGPDHGPWADVLRAAPAVLPGDR